MGLHAIRRLLASWRTLDFTRPPERWWLAKFSPSCGNQRIEEAFGRPGPARL
jgi:hypothetical protein